MDSFFLEAFRRFAGGILRLFPVSQNSFVLLSAKSLDHSVKLNECR